MSVVLFYLILTSDHKVHVHELFCSRYRGLCEAYIRCAMSASALLRSFHTSGSMNKTQTNQYEDWMKMLDEITTRHGVNTSQSDASYMKMADKLRMENIKVLMILLTIARQPSLLRIIDLLQDHGIYSLCFLDFIDLEQKLTSIINYSNIL